MKVRFVPQNVEFEIDENESVLKLAQRKGVYIKSVCNGVPSCTECRVRIVEGEYNVLPPGTSELSLIGSGYFIDRRRLSCQLRCFGDVTIDLSEQQAKQNAPGKKAKGGRNRTDDFEDSYAIKGALLDEGPQPEQDTNAGAISLDHSRADLADTAADGDGAVSRARSAASNVPGSASRNGPRNVQGDAAGEGGRRRRGRRGGRGRQQNNFKGK